MIDKVPRCTTKMSNRSKFLRKYILQIYHFSGELKIEEVFLRFIKTNKKTAY